MAAYVIVEIDVTDPARYEDYKAAASATIAQHGGKYLVRGGRAELLEGEGAPRRIVVLEFPTLDQAKGWFHSSEYLPAKKIRQESARARMIVVEGL